MNTKNLHTKAVANKKRTSKVASKHAKTLVSVPPVNTVALMQAAFAAGQAASSSFYSHRAGEALSPNSSARAPDLDTMYQVLKEGGAVSAEAHRNEAKALLNDVSADERKLFADTISLDDKEIEAPSQPQGDDVEQLDRALAALLGMDPSEMSDRAIDETSDDDFDGSPAAFPC